VALAIPCALWLDRDAALGRIRRNPEGRAILVSELPSSALDEAHFAVLRDIPWTPYGPEGLMPISWADLNLDQWKGFDPPLPARRQSRTELRAYCRDPDTPPMHAFIAVMAWGKQLPRSDRYREEVQAKQGQICNMVTAVRRGMTRVEAYDRWRGQVWGLGPSYFTKLLAFLCPCESMAIMDQWAAKAVNLLYRREIVRLNAARSGTSTSPSSSNTGKHYECYCHHLEDLQHRLGEASLSSTEERIFSRRGNGTWRDHVEKHWMPRSTP
jgi:hypothetical protein